jgi:hypothetical protein
MDMQPNVGTIDALIRYILGIALLVLVVLLDSPWRWLGFLGIIPLVTAAISFCPLWRLLGIDTRGDGHGPATHVH